MPDLALMAAKARAALAGRPYWQARYRDGSLISEWERDWTLLPRPDLIEARLVCPNGDVAVLGNPEGAGTRLFQFKTAVLLAGVGRSTDGYVLGILIGSEGLCHLAVWEPDPGRLLTFTDNVLHMKYRNVGALGLDNLHLKLT